MCSYILGTCTCTIPQLHCIFLASQKDVPRIHVLIHSRNMYMYHSTTTLYLASQKDVTSNLHVHVHLLYIIMQKEISSGLDFHIWLDVRERQRAIHSHHPQSPLKLSQSCTRTVWCIKSTLNPYLCSVLSLSYTYMHTHKSMYIRVCA